MFQRLDRGGWPYSPQPPNVDFEINRDSPQADGLVMWMPWGGGTPGAHSQHVDRIHGLAFTEGGTPVWVSDGERGWSLEFNRAASEYLKVDQAVVDAYPLSVSCWFRSDNTSNTQGLIWLGDKNAAADYLLLELWGSHPANRIRWLKIGSVSLVVGSYSANKWYFACAVAAASDDHALYLDTSKATSNTNTAFPAVDRTAIGGRLDSSPSDYMSGRIMDVRVYNVAKIDAQVHQIRTAPWELWRPRTRQLWAMYPAVARIPRPPAAYNTLMIY